MRTFTPSGSALFLLALAFVLFALALRFAVGQVAAVLLVNPSPGWGESPDLLHFLAVLSCSAGAYITGALAIRSIELEWREYRQGEPD